MPNKGNKLPKLVRLAELIAVLAFFVLIKSLMLYCMINVHIKAAAQWLSLIQPKHEPDVKI